VTVGWSRSYVTVHGTSPTLAHVRFTGSSAFSETVLVIVSPMASYLAVETEVQAIVDRQRRVVVADHPGTGGSDPWVGSLNDWVNQVGGAVDAHELVAIGPPSGGPAALLDLAERLVPRVDGAHFVAAIDAARAAWVFGPWNQRTIDARRATAVPDAAALHDAALRLLEAPETLVVRGAWFESLPSHRFQPLRVAQEVDPSRSYVNTRFGRIHLYTYGQRTQKPTVLALHPSPGSARPYAPVALRLGVIRRVVAPDMLGNGDSDAPVLHHALVDALSPEFGDRCGTSRTMADYADEAVAVLDALGENEPVDVWGNHTGALIGLELAIRHPRRVRRLVLDGITIFDASETADILANYLPPFDLDEYGAHLLRAWGMRHDMALFWPWYRTNARGARATGALSVDALHAHTMELLRSGPTFRVAYDAAFRYPTVARLPLVTVPTMLTVNPADPLAGAADQAGTLLPSLRRTTIGGYGPDDLDASVAAITDFLDS
jgi:pimeloyl-ACP methyl ester carboxylesterase